jgi:DnaK suppressor protein
VTNAVQDHTLLLQRMLEEQFEAYTEHLSRIVMRGVNGAADPDPDVARADSASSRQALADIAHALRRMAEGSYGRCERCGQAIPVARLEVMPQTRYCVLCQPSA